MVLSLLIILTWGGGFEEHVSAQDRGAFEGERQHNEEFASPGDPDLPGWAAPAPRRSAERKGTQSNRNDNQPSLSGSTPQARCPTCPPGSEVPVDGGLLWLILAGGGYATWKLGGDRDGMLPFGG